MVVADRGTPFRMATQECLSGRYRLVEWLGAGGMSVVWSAFDEVLERPVAVKLPAIPADDGLRRRIQREARSAARLVHPHIASVFDYGETESDGGESSPYVVMELVSGVPLSSRLSEEGQLPWPEAATICAQIAAALAEAHANDVVHRDVKPPNVLLTPAGAKLVDFGIAAAVGETEDESDLLGTPAYIAPERLARTLVGSAADVYGLGLVLYRALAGRMPWDAETVTQVLSAHLVVDPAPLPPLPGVPAEVIEICEACLAKEPSARPTAAEVATVLAGAVGVTVPLPEGNGADARPVSPAALPATLVHIGPPVFADRPQSALPSLSPRAIRMALLTLAAFGVAAVLVATTAAAARPGPTARLAMVDTATAEPFRCGIVYQVESARRDRFDAVVQVTHAGGAAPAEPVLRFAFPGDQAVAASADTLAVQMGREVLTPVVEWPAGGTATVRFAGTRGSYNPMPTTFYVNATQGDALVSGPPTTAADPRPSGDRDDDDNRGPGGGGHGRKKKNDD
jgi:serine/threonine-protein kinase